MPVVRVVSLYWDNIDTDVRQAQRDVFAALQIPIEQINMGGMSHGDAMQAVTNEAMRRGIDYVVFFDIDCIPLHRHILEDLYLPVMSAGALIGPAQVATHLSERWTAAPAALGVSLRLYDALDRPSFCGNAEVDVAGQLTVVCEDNGIPVVKLPVTSCEREMWNHAGLRFGIGTTYARAIYHTFLIRTGTTRDTFMNRCRQVIADNAG